MTRLKSILREPLVHFLLIGVGVFTIFAALDGGQLGSAKQSIVVTDARVNQLAAAFEAVWRRPPTTEELSSILADHVREEVYVREALALGLDQNDAVIRRRLRQKMEFLVEAETLEPDEATLRAHYDGHADRFRATGRIAFRQVYLGEAPVETDVSKVRTALVEGADPEMLGAPTLLPHAMPMSPPVAVDGTFGTGFFEEFDGLETGAWAGPIRSGYGLHLIRVDGRMDAQIPPFEAVRAAVLYDWTQVAADRIADQRYRALRARYRVILPDSVPEIAELQP